MKLATGKKGRLKSSVDNPDPVLLDPGSGMGKKSRSGSGMDKKSRSGSGIGDEHP
jgi:hypothetical protein